MHGGKSADPFRGQQACGTSVLLFPSYCPPLGWADPLFLTPSLSMGPDVWCGLLDPLSTPKISKSPAQGAFWVCTRCSCWKNVEQNYVLGYPCTSKIELSPRRELNVNMLYFPKIHSKKMPTSKPCFFHKFPLAGSRTRL